MTRFLITGASGFVGIHLLRELQGQSRVFAVARGRADPARELNHPNVEWLHADVSRREDVLALRGLVLGQRRADSAVLPGQADLVEGLVPADAFPLPAAPLTTAPVTTSAWPHTRSMIPRLIASCPS